MSKLEWLDGCIKVEPPKRPKKMTGTRFGAVLGYNKWSTPFKVWCEMTRTHEDPFVSSKYTEAGKVIEPKQAMYAKIICGFPGFVSPESRYGKDYFKKTYGDFFPDEKIFGGMWDYLSYELVPEGSDEKITVLEMKTTKRAEDWAEDIPEYYALQAALYAYLLGSDDVCMVCSFLEDSDYDHPENFKPTNKNTITVPFKLSERYPNFYTEYICPAVAFWNNHVLTGISPEYDEKRDADILKELRKQVVDTSSADMTALIEEAERLQEMLDTNAQQMSAIEKRLKVIKDGFKKDAEDMLVNGTEKAVYAGAKTMFTVSKSVSMKVDTDAMKKDGIYEKYLKPTETIKLTVSAVK